MVEVSGSVGVVEALSEAIDENTRVGGSDNDLGVGTIAVVERQEASAQGSLVLIVDRDLLGNGVRARCAVVEVGLHGADTDNTEEAALGLEKSEDDNGKGDADGGVDSVLDAGEDGNEDTSEEDGHLKGRDAPELVNDLGRGDDISDSVDDDSGESCVGNVEEDSSQSVESQQHNNSSNDTSEGSADTSLCLDGSSGEGSSGGVGTEEGTEQVGDTNGDELLRRVDDVVVDTAEGLGDGDVLNQDDDDGGGKLRDEGLDDADVDLGGGSVGETTGDSLDDADHGIILAVDVDASADSSVQQDDEGGSQGGDEEVQLGALRLALGESRADGADAVEHDQGGQAEGGVDLGGAEVLEGVDDDLVRGSTRVDALDAHELGDLAGGDGDAGASHEGADGGKRDELDEPSNASKADEGDNRTDDDGESRSNDVTFNVRDRLGRGQNDVTCDLRHDRNGLQDVSWTALGVWGGGCNVHQ